MWPALTYYLYVGLKDRSGSPIHAASKSSPAFVEQRVNVPSYKLAKFPKKKRRNYDIFAIVNIEVGIFNYKESIKYT